MDDSGYLHDEGAPPLARVVPSPLAGLVRMARALGRWARAALRAMLPPVPFRKAHHRWYEAHGVASSGS